MITLSNQKKKIIIVVSIIAVLIIFSILFVILFKFDKYYESYMQSINGTQYLIVNKSTYDYLTKSGNIPIKYNDLYYDINYNFLNKYNDLYVYLTDFHNMVENNNLCYILVKNITIFQLLKG